MELGLRAPTLTDTQFLGSCIFNEKSTISNNVLEYSPLPNQPKKWPGGQQDHGHEVVLSHRKLCKLFVDKLDIAYAATFYIQSDYVIKALNQ